ncbi:MAG: hypothetical protein ACRC67_14875 [Inquilinus sp.]|uniref:hypothetical protein n=1 Tax=Inquilinus sp. TaxID=1932117 RepID=UPI003F311C0E
MQDMEIKPTISVWEADRWRRIDTVSKLLHLIEVLSGELPRAEPHIHHDSTRLDAVAAEHRRLHDLIRRLERERDAGEGQLSTATAAQARGFISTYRRVFEGILP